MEISIDSLIDSGSRRISKQILEPYRYLEDIPSNNKNVRSKFLIAFNLLYYNIPHEALLEKIGEVISIFHNSSLLIDDIEDNSSYRRGLPTAHTKFGIPLTINCGNLMYFIALQTAQNELPALYLSLQGETSKIAFDKLKFDISQVLVDEMLNLHHGQGLDIYWRDNFAEIQNSLPSIEEYLYMVRDKTGGLFRLSIKLLDLFSSQPYKKSTIKIGNLLGIIYQIRDDYLNLNDSKYSNMKGVEGEDLIEGKLSLPILHCLHNSVNSPVKKFLVTFKTSEERMKQNALIKECIDYMKYESQSLKFTRDLVKCYESKVIQMIRYDVSFSDENSKTLIETIAALCKF